MTTPPEGAPQAPPPPPLPGENPSSVAAFSPPGLAVATGWLLITLGIGCAAYGLAAAYGMAGRSRLVGGDAYNLIVIAGRGLAWIGCGLLLAIAGAAAMIGELVGWARVRYRMERERG